MKVKLEARCRDRQWRSLRGSSGFRRYSPRSPIGYSGCHLEGDGDRGLGSNPQDTDQQRSGAQVSGTVKPPEVPGTLLQG